MVSQLSVYANEINEAAQRGEEALPGEDTGSEEFLLQHLEGLWYLYCKLREKL